MANPNIGHIMCPINKTLSVVRADCRGKKYYFSQAGKITPNLPAGQKWLNDNFTPWPAPDQPPEGVTVSILVQGAPPLLIQSLTPLVERKPAKIPLTVAAVTEVDNPAPARAQRQSALGYLFGGEK